MENKKQILIKYKVASTGLLLMMVSTYIIALYWQEYDYYPKISGYLKSFSEAAMVGALADWFAVTAIFRKPLGLPISHTNIIETRKDTIGDNLGAFVVDNFLTPQSIRPYIQRLKIAIRIGEWVEKPQNIAVVMNELQLKFQEIIEEIEEEKIIDFITKKSTILLQEINLNRLVSNALAYIIQEQHHQQWFDYILHKVKTYIQENEQLIKEKVRAESLPFIPKFIDDLLAERIKAGLYNYFTEIENNPSHPLRREMDEKIKKFIENIASQTILEKELNHIKTEFLHEPTVNKYAGDLWRYFKRIVLEDLSKSTEQSLFKSYLNQSVKKVAHQLKNDENLQQKIDKWLQKNAYQYILRNRKEVGNLISNTVGSWKGRELSDKLELEVGKDLQFIRINGTIVGGAVGLIIYTITQFFCG